MMIRLDYIGLKYAYPSKGLKNSSALEERCYFDHFLMPKIDDKGDITGSYMMYCLSADAMPAVKLK